MVFFFLLKLKYQYMGKPVSISAIPMAASRGREKNALKTRKIQNNITRAGTTG
jgi:hypothetical protein